MRVENCGSVKEEGCKMYDVSCRMYDSGFRFQVPQICWLVLLIADY